MLKRFLKWTASVIDTGIFILLFKMNALADGAADFLKSDSGGGAGSLDELNTTVQEYSRSGYTLLTTIGFACAGFFGILAAIRMMSTDPRKRNEGKDSIFWVLVGAALLGGMIALINFATGIGNTLTLGGGA